MNPTTPLRIGLLALGMLAGAAHAADASQRQA
jgi:hypothetical protein